MENRRFSTDRPISISYVLKSEISSYQKLDAVTCSVMPKTNWNLIQTTIGTIDFNETKARTESNTKYITELAAICPGHDKDIARSMDAVEGRQVYLKIEFKSGKNKIIGDVQNLPRLFFDVDSYTSTERRLRVYWENSTPNLYME